MSVCIESVCASLCEVIRLGYLSTCVSTSLSGVVPAFLPSLAAAIRPRAGIGVTTARCEGERRDTSEGIVREMCAPSLWVCEFRGVFKA